MRCGIFGGVLALLLSFDGARAETPLRPVARPAVILQPVIVPSPEVFPIPEGGQGGSAGGVISAELRPPARPAQLPQTRFQHMEGHALWTRVALSALKSHGKPLVDLVPGDIRDWCPAYAKADAAARRAFWVGFMSALSKHESTYRPWAVGGGGRWYGLLQILPATARGYRCNVGSGEALKNGAANLSCAVRIMAETVPRDGVIHGYRGRKGLGVTADWGPMHSAVKRRDMAAWLKRQNYCQDIGVLRPQTRPANLAQLRP